MTDLTGPEMKCLQLYAGCALLLLRVRLVAPCTNSNRMYISGPLSAVAPTRNSAGRAFHCLYTL